MRVLLTAEQQLLMGENRNSPVEGRLHIDPGALQLVNCLVTVEVGVSGWQSPVIYIIS